MNSKVEGIAEGKQPESCGIRKKKPQTLDYQFNNQAFVH
jgi:hypothetical protein